MLKLTKEDLERLRTALSGRTPADRRREHREFVAALEEFVARNREPAGKDGGTRCR